MHAPALPYGQHLIEADDLAAARAALDESLPSLDAEDRQAALAALVAPQITQGPRVAAFERALAAAVGAAHAVACASGTAALHLALRALDVGEGDLCVVPSITFLSTATAVRMCGAEVVFADVDPDTGLMRPQDVTEAAARAGRPAKAALPVHLGGRPCDMPGLAEAAKPLGMRLIEDGCHALGSRGEAGRVGENRFADATVFSFHPVKTIACGEGGAVTTSDAAMAARMARLRNHGVTREADLMVDAGLSLDAGGAPNPWSYEQLELGFNYRMTEVEAALGASQLGKLDRFVRRRLELAALYDRLLAPWAPRVRPIPGQGGDASLHLYGVLIDFAAIGQARAPVMRALAAQGVGTQVHYIPVYRQPYFAQRYGPQRLPGAESYYARALSLPLFPAMAEDDVQRVALALAAALGA